MIHGGAVHFSKEFIEVGERRVFGCLAEDGFGAVDESSPLLKLTQEHGTVRLGESASRLRLGDLAVVYPVHACLTADLHTRYRLLDGAWIRKWGGGR